MIRMVLLLIKKDIKRLVNDYKTTFSYLISLIILSYFGSTSPMVKDILYSNNQSDILSKTYIFIFISFLGIIKSNINYEKGDIIPFLLRDKYSYFNAVSIKQIVVEPIFLSAIITTLMRSFELSVFIKIFMFFTLLNFIKFISNISKKLNREIFKTTIYAILTISAINITIVKLNIFENFNSNLHLYPIFGWWIKLFDLTETPMNIFVIFTLYIITTLFLSRYIILKSLDKAPDYTAIFERDQILFKNILDSNKSNKSLEYKGSGAKSFYYLSKQQNSFFSYDSIVFILLGVGFGIISFYTEKRELGLIILTILSLIIGFLLTLLSNSNTQFQKYLSSYFFYILPDNPKNKLFYAIKYELLRVIFNSLLFNLIFYLFWRYDIKYFLISIFIIPSYYIFMLFFSILMKLISSLYGLNIKSNYIKSFLKGFINISIIAIFSNIFFIFPKSGKLETYFYAIFIIQIANIIPFITIYYTFDKIYSKLEY
ncbi:MAG: hypothetical protein CR982_02830 [Candidatus Cloacimonadota bacterium]|nr:MAG: hypothetical protein CR982_02830 [Candidatus Cloacimonadota bacterium]PIE79204.1 MAG: hypothetical protein CSA15_04025 [Candidatus Delongbacteria bacterium]